MSLYDDNPLLLARPRPFWEEEEEPVVPPVVIPPPVAPPAAPPPEIEGPGYASLEDIPEEAPPPEVVGPGYTSLEEIPEEQPPPEVEGPGYASLDEIPEPEEEGLLKKAGRFALATGQLLAPNLGQAKAVLDPDTQEAARNAVSGVPDYWERIKGRWTSGQEMAEDEVLKYDALSGKVPWEEIKDKAELSEALKLKAQEDEKQPWYYKGPLIAVEQVPMMLESLKEGSKRALEWGLAGGTAGAIGGAIGGPAAPVTSTAGAIGGTVTGGSLGMSYGTAEYWRRQGSGSLYHELRKEGVPHEIAKNVGLTFGVPYAAVELLQMTKLVPGMKQAAAHAIAGSVKKKLLALGLEGVADVGENVAQELGQELLQAGHEGFAEWRAGVTPPANKKGLWDRAVDTIYNTAISVPFLRLPKTAVDAAKIIAQGDTTPVAPAVPGEVAPPPIPPTPDEAFAPGVTITPASGEVPTPADITGAPPVISPGVPVAGAATASVPTMVTKQMEADLTVRGYTQNAINGMTPQQAHFNLQLPPGIRVDAYDATTGAPHYTGGIGGTIVPPTVGMTVRDIRGVNPGTITEILPDQVLPNGVHVTQVMVSWNGKAPVLTSPAGLRLPPGAAIPIVPTVTTAAPPVVPGAPSSVTGDERFAPPVMPTPVEPGQPPTPEGVAVTKQVGAENLVVKEVADHQAVKLQSANAPKTAQAIQQVAQRSNAGATVSAAEFLQQARAQAAEAQAEANEKAAVEAEKVAKETAKAAPTPGAVKPGEFAQPGYTAAAPAQAAPEAAPPTEYPSAVVVGGQVFTGATHEDATRAAHAAVGPDAMVSSEGGWVDPETGRFSSHEVFEAHRDLNTAIEQSSGNWEAPAVQEAQAQLAEAVARDDELNSQIVRPGGEQVIKTGIKGQQALVSVRPSQELAVPLAGVGVSVEGVTPDGQRTTAQRPAAQALNDARNDRTAFQILLNCLL